MLGYVIGGALIGVSPICVILNYKNTVNLVQRSINIHNLSSDTFLTSEQIARRREKIASLAGNFEMPEITGYEKPLKVITESCTKEELLLLRHNLQTLKIKKRLFSLSGCDGVYIGDKNTIIIYKDLAMTHELCHVASCMVMSVGGIGIMGFMQENLKTKKHIGSGLNEGYTEGLFDKEAYPKTVALIPLIEMFYDDTKTLRRNYFNADLPAVVDYFSQIEGREKALELIHLIDLLTLHDAYRTWGDKSQQYELIVRRNLCDKYQKWSGKAHTEESFFTPEMLNDPKNQKLILRK